MASLNMASTGGSDSVTPNKTIGQQISLSEKIKALIHFIFHESDDEITIMGRTPSSWVKIVLFYLTFYSCLGVFFAVTTAIFYQTIDWDYPKLQGSDSILSDNPGLGIRPMPDVRSSLIRFVKGKPSTFKIYTDHLKGFLDYYEDNQQIGDNFMACRNLKNYRDKSDWNKVCKFDLSLDFRAGPEQPCVIEDDYGYDDGVPCILLKLNKIYGWLPEPYINGTVPDAIIDDYDPDYIKVKCEGETLADKENIGEIMYFPQNGFHYRFYPYLNQQGYRQPLVFIHFPNLTNGVVVMIRCKAYAKNIRHNNMEIAGSVHFELMID